MTLHGLFARHQRGISLTEFVVIGPLLLFIGMAGIQLALLYNARLNVSYAAYEAARAGAIHNADPARIQMAFFKGMVPYFSAKGIFSPTTLSTPTVSGVSTLNAPESLTNLYANTQDRNEDPLLVGKPVRPNQLELAAKGWALIREIQLLESPFIGIHLVNPSKSSFTDWNDPKLQQLYEWKTGQKRRVIANDSLRTADPTLIGKTSRQSLADANVLKLRITYGYQPRIPLMAPIFNAITTFFAGQRDALGVRLMAANRIPISVDVSAQMLSPAIEGGLPTTTVNRQGFLIGENLVNTLVNQNGSLWQAGNTPTPAEQAIVDQLKSKLQTSLNDAVKTGNVSGLGADLMTAVQDTGSSLTWSNTATGEAGWSTGGLFGDMNNLIGCSSTEEMVVN